jgi:phosphonate transport system substrate-binding protein
MNLHLIVRVRLLLAACLLASLPALAETPIYSFAVVPQFKPSQLQQEWGPVLERVSRETGVKLKLEIAPSIARFEQEISKGTPDFAFMNPYQALKAVKTKGYLPMLRDKKALNGILVVSKDSGIRNIADLEGKVIGFPSPNAFGATIYLSASLTEKHAIKFTPRYLNNHNLVFKHVLLGNVAAGGSVNSALNDEPASTREQLTVLYKTPDLASHPIVAHPRVPEAVRKNVMHALQGMMQDSEGAAMLKEIRMPNLVEANFQQDYAPLEKLDFEKFLPKE